MGGEGDSPGQGFGASRSVQGPDEGSVPSITEGNPEQVDTKQLMRTKMDQLREANKRYDGEMLRRIRYKGESALIFTEPGEFHDPTYKRVGKTLLIVSEEGFSTVRTFNDQFSARDLQGRNGEFSQDDMLECEEEGGQTILRDIFRKLPVGELCEADPDTIRRIMELNRDMMEEKMAEKRAREEEARQKQETIRKSAAAVDEVFGQPSS